MADEKQYIINLRREFIKAPSYKKSMKAVKAIREYIMKHMKSDNVKICKELNLKIWEHGCKNPVHKIKVKAIKEEDHILVQLPELDFPKKKEKKIKTEKKEGLAGKLQEKLEGIHNKDEMKKETEDKKQEKIEPETEAPSKELKNVKAKSEQVVKERRVVEAGKSHNEKKVRNF
jgi:large subunit ribosomal protein L31e